MTFTLTQRSTQNQKLGFAVEAKFATFARVDCYIAGAPTCPDMDQTNHITYNPYINKKYNEITYVYSNYNKCR